MIKKLFSHTAIYGLAPYVPKLLGFVTLPIITKDLSSFDYGVAGIVGAYSGAIGVFNTLGLRLILVNSFYHYVSQYKWMWRQIYGFLSLWVLVFGASVSTLLFFVIPAGARDNAGMIVLLNVIPLVLFGPVGLMGSTYFQLKQQPLQIATRTAIFGVLTIILNVYFISVLKLGYLGWFLAECLVSLLHNASYWYVVNIKLGFKPIYNFKRRLIKRSLKVAMPMVPHYYSTYLLNSSDRMVMDWLKIPTPSIGKYNIAANFGNYFNSISMASGFAIGPMLNKLFKEGKDLKARNLIWTLQVIFLAGTFIFSLWLKEIFFLLIKNEELNKMYPLAVIIVMAYNYRPMYFGANAKVFYKEKTNLLLRVTFIAGVLNLVLNLIFIPFWGIAVAAITTFIAYMYMGYIGFLFKQFRKIIKVNYYPMFWLSITIALTILAYCLVEFSVIWKVILSLLCLTIILVVYGKYRRLLN
jgi:O-antigen/teichoic acid export membrane protein